MQPAGRTVSFDRGWIVNYLGDFKVCARSQWKVEIAGGSNFFPANRDFHRSWCDDASLVGRDDFVLNAAPGNATAEERGEEIEQIQKWDYECDDNVNPRLRHDLRTGGGNCLRHPDYPQSATEGRKEQGKYEKRNDLGRRPRLDSEIECDHQAEEKGGTKQKVRCESRGPHFGTINPGDFDLAIGEFDKVREIGLDVRRGEAFGKKNDLAAGSLDGDGEGVVIAEGVLPYVQHAHFLEKRTANRRAATPAEISVVAAKHGYNGGIPRGEKRVGKGVVVGDEPTHGGGCANAGIRKGSYDVVQPGFSRATVGVNEYERFEVGRKLFDSDAKIVDLLTGGGWFAGDNDVSLDPRRSSDALDEAVRGIVFRSENEKDFEILVSEFGERDKVALESGLHAAAGAENGSAGSIKAWIGMQAAAHVGEPLDTLPKQEKTRGDLQDRQKFKERFHASRA